MSDFDVSRIVPSTRDLAGAVRTARKGLALISVLEPSALSTDTEAEVKRLDAMDVRAFAIRQSGDACLRAARATESTPILLLSPATDVGSCQRARFYGADAVSLDADSFAELAKSVQSMRMMPAALVLSQAEVKVASDAGARVLVARGDLEAVLAIAEVVGKQVTLIADVIDAEADALRSLAGHVDAAVVPGGVHRSDSFEALLDELD